MWAKTTRSYAHLEMKATTDEFCASWIFYTCKSMACRFPSLEGAPCCTQQDFFDSNTREFNHLRILALECHMQSLFSIYCTHRDQGDIGVIQVGSLWQWIFDYYCISVVRMTSFGLDKAYRLFICGSYHSIYPHYASILGISMVVYFLSSRQWISATIFDLLCFIVNICHFYSQYSTP